MLHRGTVFFFVLFCHSSTILSDNTILNSKQNAAGNIEQLLHWFSGNLDINRNYIVQIIRLATNGLFSQALKSFDMDSIIDNILPNNISANCRRDLKSIVKNVETGAQSWPWEMLDSFGKLPSGLLKGNIVWAGNFWQCVNVEVKYRNQWNETQFVGEYCLLKFLPHTNDYSFVTFAIGLCWPNSCNYADKNQIVNYYLGSIAKTAVIEKYCQTAKSEPMSYTDIILTLLVLLPICLVVIGTANDYYCILFPRNPNSPDKKKTHLLTEICRVFSARYSLKSLFTTYAIDDTDHVITSLFGIRSIGMVAVIWVHVLSMNLDDFPWQNRREHHDIFKHPFAHLCAQSFVVISTFFVISGFCLSYSSLLSSQRQNGTLNVIQCYVFRYIRIMPMYFYMIAFNGGPFYYLWKGPFWPIVKTIQSHCQSHFWRKLLNFENFFERWENEGECVTGEWFLGADWQLYLVAVPLVLVMAKKPRISFCCIMIGMFITTAVWVAMKITTPTFSIFYGLSRSRLTSSMESRQLTRYFYVSFWSRIPCFGLGMIGGYYLVHFRKTLHFSKAANVLGHVFIAVVFVILELLGRRYFTSYQMSTITEIFYFLFVSFIYPCTLCWIIFLCAQYPTGTMNRFISAKLFQCLGKLSFGMYLVHKTILFWYYGSSVEPNIATYYSKVLDMILIITLSTAAAFLLHIVVESPLERLIKLFKQHSLNNEKSKIYHQ